MAKLLIIEDETNIQVVITRIVAGMGHSFVLAADGANGVRLATDPDVKLILSDLRMPGQPSGMELIRRLRGVRPDCPLLVVTGYPLEADMAECMRLGVAQFLTKPFEIPFIQSVVDRLLNAGGGSASGPASIPTRRE